jgi:hypothetical protein
MFVREVENIKYFIKIKIIMDGKRVYLKEIRITTIIIIEL